MSTPLYERTKQILDLWAAIDFYNTADHALSEIEAADRDALIARLAEAEDGFEKKVEACAAAAREMEASAAVAADEADRLGERAKAFANRARRLKEYVRAEMEAAGCPKVETELFTVSVRKNQPSVNVIDSALIPRKFIKTETVDKLDKREVAAAIKAGEEVPGAELVASTSLVIK